MHDGKTVICYFMPRLETSTFLYNVSTGRYKVNLMNKKQPEPKGGFICNLTKKLSVIRSYLNTGISDDTQIAGVV